MTRHLISVDDLSDGDLRAIVDAAVASADDRAALGTPLSGLVGGIYFTKTSTRTRTSFSVAALRLGAQIVSYGPSDLQTNTGETWADTGRVLAGALDFLVARTAGSTAALREWGAHGRMSVINAMSIEEHPTQALSDLAVLTRHFGAVDGLRVLYVGEGNNTAAALALALPRYPGVVLELRCPPDYGLRPEILQRAREIAARTGSTVTTSETMADIDARFDVIYTTRWQTTGTSKRHENWRERFVPFQVAAPLLDAVPDAVVMHDLPAHRDEEISAEALDGPRSIAFQQADGKVAGAMAVVAWCAGAIGMR